MTVKRTLFILAILYMAIARLRRYGLFDPRLTILATFFESVNHMMDLLLICDLVRLDHVELLGVPFLCYS